MLGLRKHIQRSHATQLKDTSLAQNVQVPRQGGWMAGDVKYLSGPHFAELFQRAAWHPGPGWIQNYRRFRGRESLEKRGQLLLRLAQHELAVEPMVSQSVVL